MSSAVVVIDCQVSYPRSGGHGRSLLTQCLGTGCLLDEVLRSIQSLSPSHLWILNDGDVEPADHEVLLACGPLPVVLCKSETLPSRIGLLESSDLLVVIEPRYWLIDGFDAKSLLNQAAQYRGVTHIIGVGSEDDDARERLDCDSGGRVRRVRRLYGDVLWHHAVDDAVVCSLLPVGLLPDASFGSLAELRVLLASNGVLSQDLPIRSAVVDLAEERGFLTVHERVLEKTSSLPLPSAWSRPSGEVIIAADARIDRSAQLLPPVIVQRGATIEENAIVIGPTVIGANSRVGKNSIIAQAVVSAGTQISAGRTIQARVASSDETEDEDTSAHERAVPAPPQTMHSVESADLKAVARMEAGGTGRRVQLAVKRIGDVVIASLSLIILSPLLALVAIVIKIDSPGPVFFAHRRERRGGRDFPCLKFRTMVTNAHSQQRELYSRNEVDGPQFKIRKDPRVTRAGRWLRATNIDELPQLVNVLAGHMSLVGPRPSPFRENQICVPWRRARLSVRPGVTGLWQLCRHGDGGFHQWIYYDIMYVRHFSCWLDLKILALTVLSLAGRRTVPLHWLIGDLSRPTTVRRQFAPLLNVERGASAR